ncbi:hypothetical protein BG006_005964 [Podila minutissima]|uniref:RNA helicase n=1 Tax=Podila minutissima TaxID=64525 RepID=A0A9P5VLZ7_9FUNG|nr:hypothetical protein BG006_005964 [Podila minutissima]
MSWLLKSKRLQSAGNNTTGIYSLGSNSNTSGSSFSNNNNNYSTGNGSSNNLLNSAPSHSFFLHQHLSSNNLHHHLDAGEDMVRQFAASQLDTQKTAFMRWVNVQLANTPYTPMAAIEKDLRDGKRLIGLLEAVSKEPLKPERGNMRIHQMANVSNALAFLEKRTDDALGTIGNEDIVDGNIKLTLGLVWIIIYRFQIQQIANNMAELYPILAEDMMDGEDSTTTTTATTTAKGKKKASSQQVDAKQALLRWVRYQLEDYSDVIPPIQDFHRSWRTGLAFTALIHRHDPEFLPEFYTSVLPLPFETSDEWKQTLTNAFDLALEKMALPRLLDPEDLVAVETPDERSIMTYISEYYLVMSKHQSEQDPAVAADLRAKRLQAKHERLALAGEDQEATRRRLQEDAERKRREEQEELERIRLRRMEIEGWSIRAAERAKEEEEALRKRRQEEEERGLQRKLRREQREKERELLRQQPGGLSSKGSIGSPRPGSVFSESELEYSDSETETLDPKEQEQRQQELDEKLAEYHQGIAELSEWIRQQDGEIPHAPDTSSPLDRARDLEPLTDAIKLVEEAQTVKEHIMSHLHDVREELLEFENPDLAPEQVSEMDKKWWELETIWTALSNKVVEAKDAAEEVKWIIDCTQEIDRVNGEIKKFESQLLAAADKRNEETIQDRSQKSALEQQDVNLSSISFLLKTYLDFLTSLMDPKVHHYDAPAHLTARNTELTTVILPHLQVIIEKAQQNLASDRLLRSFLDAFVLSEAWIGESIEWLANIEVPKFVSEDTWMGANTVQQYVTRDDSQDLDLDFYQAEVDELKMELEDEQREVTAFRSSGFAKLDEQAKTVMQSVKNNEDPTMDKTTKAVQDLMSDVMSNLVKVEDLLPKEAVNCDYTTKVLDYLLAAQSVLTEIEAAFEIIHHWEMSQPDVQVEASVMQVEAGHGDLETTFQDDTTDPYVWSSVQLRHGGLTTIVKDLRVCFHEKQEMIKGDRQMKAFLDFTVACQTTLREFRTELHNEPPWTGFGDENLTPFDKFDALVKSVGLSFDSFESGEYAMYLESGEAATIMANHSNARQDPNVIQSKLEAVARLLNDIKALKSDRERDAQTMAECRELTKSFQELRIEFSALEAEFTALHTLEPDQVHLLKELSEKSNQLGNRHVTLEQDSTYRYLAKDPSCSAILRGIKGSQSSIEQDVTRLQSNLESKQQWDLAWEKFSDRAVTLEQYLQDAEEEVVARGYHSADILCTDEKWRRSDSELREAMAANSETLSSLKAFERLRLTELSALSKALQECADLVGDAESLDPVRRAQFEESKQRQQDLVDHLNRLHGMNDKEKRQLDLLEKRLDWSQVTADSKSEVEVLIKSCQDAIQKYSQLIQKCQESDDLSDINLRAAEQMKEQVEHLASLAVTKKAVRKGAAHDAYMALAQQASIGGLSVPANLDKEMFDFKDQHTLLDSHLAYASQLAQHAEQIASYLQKADSVDNDLINAATDLKSDREASVESIENTNQARAAFSALSKELDSVLSGPTPSDKIEEHYKDSTKDQQNLEAMLKTRLQSSLDLDQALQPLMGEFRGLLEYQDSLRSLVSDQVGHDRWAEDVRLKIAAMDKSLSELFSTWPDQGADYSQGATIRQASTGTRDVLSSELEYEILNVQAKKQELVAVKGKINQTLMAATSHSRQLQATLEGSMDSIDEKVQHLESELKTKSRQLHCFDCTVAWEKDIDAAQHSLQDTAGALDELIHHDTRWSQVGRDTKKASEAQDVVDWLKAAIKDYESQLKSVEGETKPAVDRSWIEFCSSLVFASRSVPEEFQSRQTLFEQQIGALRSQIAYSHDVLFQREALDAIATKLAELDEFQQQLRTLADSPALVTDVSEDGSDLSLSELSEKIRRLAQELAADFKTVHFPVDESSAEARTRAQESNTAIRDYIHQGQSHVEQAVKTVEDTELKRELSLKQQELETIFEQQGKAISDKNSSLERVSALLTWADETVEVVAELLHQDQDSEDGKGSDLSEQTVSGSSSPEQVMSASTAVTNDLSTTVSSLNTLSMSTSVSSISTLTPTSPTASYGLSKHFPLVATLARLSVDRLESMISHVEDIRLEVDEMKEHKASVQEEISEKSALFVDMDEQIGHLAISSAQSTLTNIAGLVPTDAFQDMNMSIEQNRLALSNLDNEISDKFDQFDAKTDHLLEQLEQKAQLLSAALKERQQADIEKALREEAELFRQQKEREMEAYEESKGRFLAWTEGHRESLNELWETHGFFSRDSATQDGVTTLESKAVRCKDILKDQESMYLDLKSKMEIAFKDTDRTAELAEHTEKIDGTWSMVQNESNGYHALLKQMNAWSVLNNQIAKFEKEGLETLEKRVEALRWMPWEAFQQEEKDLLDFIDSAEAQAGVLREHASHINAAEPSLDLLEHHKQVLEANSSFFEQRMAEIPGRVQVARSQMEIIHETTKEIALHAKFHADLVRIETAIAQQIDMVKARLGSLERSSCFALNSQALETVVTAANEVSVDARYQFSVLQEVEYSALEQTAFDLDMIEGQAMNEDGELQGYEGSCTSRNTSVQESMERIRASLKRLEGYIEEDCFETLLAAEFYTHTKATEDIRQWIGACRESMTQMNAPDFGCQGMEGASTQEVRKQAIEARTRHIAGLEKKLHQFGPTIQNYDALSGDFFQLHHPASSTLNLNLPEFSGDHQDGPQDSMRTILRQTVQERTKRTREDWELLKQEFIAKVTALEELKAQQEKDEAKGNSDTTNADGLEAVRRGSMSKSKTIGRFGSDILEDIARVTHEIEVMVEHGSPSLIENLDSLAHDVEQNLEVVSNMVDRLNDWRLIEKHGAAVEHWQKVKLQALAKRQELDESGHWSRRSSTEVASEGHGSGLGIHPFEGTTSRISVMQPTLSSNNRVKAILGSPADPTPAPRRKKRFSTGNIMNRDTFSPPSPATTRTGATKATGTGRVRSGTAPGLQSSMGGPLETLKKSTIGLPSLQAMSPTFSVEAKRRPPIIRKNDSNTSISSATLVQPLESSHLLSPSLRPQRTVYKADPNSSLDVEVARVVNASGFVMKVQKLMEGQQPPLKGSNTSTTRLRSSSTVNLAVESDGNVEYVSGLDSASSSPRQVKTIRGQGRMSTGGSSPGRSGDDNSTGEVGRYMFGDVEPKVCYCRILRSRKVMVRVGGGWSELSKFMEDHASLEQRKAKGRLSATNSAVSIASTTTTTNLGGVLSDARSVGQGGSSDSLPESVTSSNGDGTGSRPRSNTGTPRVPKRKEFIYHVRPSDDLSLKTIKFVKNGAESRLEMPPKKKNKYANAAARGFATTSIPKAKAPEPEPVPEPVPEPAVATPAPQETLEQPPEAVEEEDEFVSLAERLESLSLRKVDAFLGQSQKINVDTLPVLKMETTLENNVIALLKEVEAKDAATFEPNVHLSQEQMVAKLNVTYLSLLRLGFEKDDIEVALRHTYTGESEDALDWLCMHLDSEKLPRGFADKLYHDEEQPQRPQTPVPAREPSPPPANAPMEDDAQKAWILQAALAENSEDEAEDPNERYVNYKMTLTELIQALSETKDPADRKTISRKIDTLNSKVNDLDLDFAFDKKMAEMMLKNQVNEEKKAAKKSKRKKEKEQAALKKEKQGEDGDGEDGGLMGSMWDEDGASAAPGEASSQTIRRRQMANPSWSGGSPKTVLAEFCRKKDRHTKIAYKKATGSTPSVNLATVTVIWGSGNVSTAEMKDEGCENMVEAENYVATQMLYELTPLPLYRSLPPTYRDLWLEWIDEKESAGRLAKKVLDGDRLSFIKALTGKLPQRSGAEGKQAERSVDSEEQVQLIEKEVVVTDIGRALQANWQQRLNRPAHRKLFEKRKELPMFQFRDQLLDLLKLHQVLIVSGETGCGKSTQVPQYLTEFMMEEGLGDQCDIVCTQPRRISAISIANRVSEELGDSRNSAGKPGTLVGYQIRLESKVAPTNVLKFCTTGILLRRLESDKTLKGVTHLVIDEVHERTLESDFLLIILKKLLPRRPDLKVILMSATVDSARFSGYFSGCPVLEVPGRTFPVHAQFLEDVIDTTGYTLEEDSEYAIRLYKDIRSKGSVDIAGKGASRQTVQLQWDNDAGEYAASEAEARVSMVDSLDDDAFQGPIVKNRTNQMLNRIDENRINYELIQLLLEYICFPKDRRAQSAAAVAAQDLHIPEEGAILIFLPGMPEIRKLFDNLKVNRRFGNEAQFSLWPLHSSVSSEGQSQVFDVPPPGIRKIVLATNIAETGITIPDVTIVIDTGKSKQIKFDEKKRVTTLQERFIARANARQRRGRAGRVQEGVCFHMFSKTTFEEYMPEYQMPEIMRMPLEELCLMIKMCELGDIAEVLGSALDAPPLKAIENAIQALQDVRALTKTEELTPLGIHLCNLPVDVHIGKMILFGSIFKCLDPILTIAAMLSFKSPFVTPFGAEDEADAAKSRFKLADSDMLTWYNAYLGWRQAYQTKPNKISDYCRKNFLSHQNLMMMEDMKKQFLGFLVGTGFVRVDKETKRELGRERFNHKIAFCPVVPEYNQHQRSIPVLNAAITAGMYPKVMFRSDTLKAYVTGPKQETVWIHPSSVNFTKGGVAASGPTGPDSSPWFAFNSLVKSSRMYVWESCRVGQFPLVLFGGELNVKHHAKLVTVDKWIQFKCHAKTAVVFKMMREELDKILQKRIDDPEQAMMEREERWLAMIVAILEGEDDSVRLEDKAGHQRQKDQNVFLA